MTWLFLPFQRSPLHCSNSVINGSQILHNVCNVSLVFADESLMISMICLNLVSVSSMDVRWECILVHHTLAFLRLQQPRI